MRDEACVRDEAWLRDGAWVQECVGTRHIVWLSWHQLKEEYKQAQGHVGLLWQALGGIQKIYD